MNLVKVNTSQNTKKRSYRKPTQKNLKGHITGENIFKTYF